MGQHHPLRIEIGCIAPQGRNRVGGQQQHIKIVKEPLHLPTQFGLFAPRIGVQGYWIGCPLLESRPYISAKIVCGCR